MARLISAGVASAVLFYFLAIPAFADDVPIPRQYFRNLIENQKNVERNRAASAAGSYWTKLADQLKARRATLGSKINGPIKWSLSTDENRLTQTKVFRSTAKVEDGANRARLDFACDALKKQLTVMFTDLSPAVQSIPANTRHLGDISSVYDPAPLGEQKNSVKNTKHPVDGRTVIITGLNSNSWGESLLCGSDGGGAGYVFNAAYCSTFGPKERPTGFKDWEWIRYSWLDFDEIRISSQISWGYDGQGNIVKSSHFLLIQPYAPGLKETLQACDRDENMCLSVANENNARACHANLLSSIR